MIGPNEDGAELYREHLESLPWTQRRKVMDRLDTIVKKLEYYDAGKVVLMPPHEDIVFLIRAAKALRGIVQWTDACWNGGYCGDPKAPHPAWEDVQEGRAALAALKEG